MIGRLINQSVAADFFQGKVIAVLGPRQVGKTTLLSQLSIPGTETLWLNCDNIDDSQVLEGQTTTGLQQLVGNKRYVVIDEAQRVKNIGLTLKMMADTFRDRVQVVVTGSSSLELSNQIYEPATGRIFKYRLYPFSLAELSQHYSVREERRLLEQRLIYGCYPEVVTHPDHAKRILTTIASNYLYKDLLSYNGIRKPEVLSRLLQALAMQVGEQVSYNELSRLIGIDRATVESYIDLLEKCFVIFRLPSYSGNLRTELRHNRKIYFYDNGIRNAILSNFAPLNLRTDAGALWENMMLSERVKHNAYRQSYAQIYFWRTQAQAEIDFVEIEDGAMQAFEFKFNPKKLPRAPKAFTDTYPEAVFQVITPDNYTSFVGVE
ncbi:MAG: ATP-binding protein [Mediterranea sp.]|nr:ATP-binding protein [Mediterranea sp.]